MRRTNWFMKLLIILPAVLLIILLGWMTMDWWKLNHSGQSYETYLPESDENGKTQPSGGLEDSVSSGNEGNTETIESGDQGSAAATSSEEVLKVNLSETEASEIQPETETAPEDPILHLLFGGDVYFSSHVLEAYNKAGGIHGVLDEGYRAEIAASDIFMVNEEFPFSNGGTPKDKTYTFRLPTERVSMMHELGIDIVSLANNHTLDYGEEALVDTCTTLEGAGIPYVGAGVNMDRAKQLETIEVRGRTVGFLAASRVFPDTTWIANSKKPGMVSGYDPKILLEQVESAGELCDYLVVYIHWGIERDETPKEYQRNLGKSLIDAGADIVIGSHPHVLQGIEYYNGKPIIYSLGNFVFGSSIPKTALLRVNVDPENQSASLSLVPGTSGAGYTKVLTDEAKKEEFYNYIESISFGVTIDENGSVIPPS